MKRWQKITIVIIIYLSGLPLCYRMSHSEFKNLDTKTLMPGILSSWVGVGMLSIKRLIEKESITPQITDDGE